MCGPLQTALGASYSMWGNLPSPTPSLSTLPIPAFTLVWTFADRSERELQHGCQSAYKLRGYWGDGPYTWTWFLRGGAGRSEGGADVSEGAGGEEGKGSGSFEC